MRRSALYLAAILAVPFAAAAQTPTDQAQTTSTQPSTQTTQTTQTSQTAPTTPETTRDATQASDLGKHLQEVTPEHPLEHGRDFGECVREMAMGGDCPLM